MNGYPGGTGMIGRRIYASISAGFLLPEGGECGLGSAGLTATNIYLDRKSSLQERQVL